MALPKSIWKHIRSFSADTGYEPTPTARLMKNRCFSFDIYGNYHFPEFGRDGYSSLIVHTSGIVCFENLRTNVGIQTALRVLSGIGVARTRFETFHGRSNPCGFSI